MPDHATVDADALSAWNAVEERYDQKRGLPEGRRLGCQACVEKDVVIDVPAESQVHRQVVRKAAALREIVMAPATRTYYVPVTEPDMHEPSGDFERLKDALSRDWGLDGVTAPLSLLAKLQPALRKGGWAVTVAVPDGGLGAPRLIGVWAGDHGAPL